MILEIPEGEFAGTIFDCDGTLVDSMPLHFRAWIASMEHHNCPWTWTEELFYESAGRREQDIVNDLNAEYHASIDADSVHDWKADWFRSHLDELTAVEAVAEVVRDLHARGELISVATGSDISVVEPELKHIGLWDYFDIIITPTDVKRGKPAPDMFLLAAERMGVAPEKCLVYEDGQAGIDGAVAAGMQTVFVPSRISG